ncbi:ClC family H(+)/Cl(-) exchange transporter [Papillibacter cinnamivorans]|uniref:H+/Cl-antiporter ClcA n=1 Tax=Papillibacter cinnamivorans DSM 12816 TaxID=1122930 RepID=A0A1W1ZJL3_9FIRM|nr:ClC family H(+)/Cl(-) exchange transporter [Papillibacter cinnamivorans]SMC48423.1 H+/Cl-antiporter ClcA [Papillibacter cinnamivorans DSM 12816]
MGKSKYYKIMSSLNELKWSVAAKGVASGFIAGLLVVLYRTGIEYGTEKAVLIFSYLRAHPWAILPWLAVSVALGLLLSWLVKLEPMATGSGIPQVKGLLLYGMKMKWASIIVVRFAAGFVASFFGLSLGREGPSIQIGAMGSQALAERSSKNKVEENYLITGGAAAGLSAAFNAPLAAIVFALEEVHRSFSPTLLVAATTASLTADIVSKYFFGLRPVLSFVSIPQLPQTLYIWILPLGLLTGLFGVLLNKALLGFQTLYNRMPARFRPMAALMIALPCGLFLPQVLGGGQGLIKMAETWDSGAALLFIILVVKLIFTCTSFGSGLPGGIFLPILSVGALSGSLLGLVAVHFGMPAEYIPDFAVCGMAGALSGSVKAPVTSILLTAEMTGSLVHLLPVAACSFIALLLSDILKVAPIYDALLDRMMEKNETALIKDKAGALLEIPVEFGCAVSGKTVGEVCWPQGMLIVGLHRGDEDIVPNGSTRIEAGDYLVVLSSEVTYKDMHTNIRELCHVKQ